MNFDGPDKVSVIKEVIKWITIGGPVANTNVTYTGDIASTTGPVNGFDTLTLKAPYGIRNRGIIVPCACAADHEQVRDHTSGTRTALCRNDHYIQDHRRWGCHVEGVVFD